MWQHQLNRREMKDDWGERAKMIGGVYFVAIIRHCALGRERAFLGIVSSVISI